MSRNLFLLLFFFIGRYALFAQDGFNGRVVEKQSGDPIAGVMLTVSPIGSDNILGYSVSKQDGSFSISVRTALPKKVKVSARSLMTKTKVIEYELSDGFLQMELEEEVTELDEVKVVAPIVTQRGDTISYNVESIRDSTDRSIGDVLKKLPGIRVTSSGRILYQNKEISKFYVEGLDMLQGKYAMITENLDASKIASVQILEHHQPIKVLAGAYTPETAAINIKLKKSELGAFFITAQAGAGLPVPLLSNEVVGTRFTDTQQNLVMYKGDNTGRDIVKEMTSFYNVPSGSNEIIFNLDSPTTPNIDEQYRLFNNAHVVSVNDLRLLRDGITLTSNLNYLSDGQKKEGAYIRNITTAEGIEDIMIAEKMKSFNQKQELNGTFTLEKNKSDYYLNNRVAFFTKWNSESSEYSSTNLISQLLNQPEFSLENHFESTWKKGIKTKNLTGSAEFFSQNNNFEVNPVLNSGLAELPNFARQLLSYKQFVFDIQYREYISNVRGFRFEYQLGPVIKNYDLTSDIFSSLDNSKIISDSLSNNLSRMDIGMKGYVRMTIGSDNRITFNVPVQIIERRKENFVASSKSKEWKTILTPSLYGVWYLNRRMPITVSVAYSRTEGSFTDDITGYILSSYRNVFRFNDIAKRVSMLDTRLSVDYRDPFSQVYFTTTLHYTNFWRNSLNESYYNGAFSRQSSIALKNNSDSYGAAFSLDIPMARSNIKVDAGCTRSSSLTMNQGVALDSQMDNLYFESTFLLNIGPRIIATCNSLINYNRNIIGDIQFDSLFRLTNKITLAAIVGKSITVTAALNHYYNSKLHDKPSYLFGNTSLKYKTNNVEYILDWTNMFNTTQIVTLYYGDVSMYKSTYSLRPSEILLRVRFSIL